jgi:hypothetical protein
VIAAVVVAVVVIVVIVGFCGLGCSIKLFDRVGVWSGIVWLARLILTF